MFLAFPVTVGRPRSSQGAFLVETPAVVHGVYESPGVCSDLCVSGNGPETKSRARHHFIAALSKFHAVVYSPNCICVWPRALDDLTFQIGSVEGTWVVRVGSWSRVTGPRN